MSVTVDCGEGKHGLCTGRGRTAYLFPQESRERDEPPFNCGCWCHHHGVGVPCKECAPDSPQVHDGGQRKVSRPLSGVERIMAERQRQIEAEGWSASHDDEHDAGELGGAAICYIQGTTDGGWPWDMSWWKPSDDPIRNLTKAGALIAAEIDRLQREPMTEKGTP